MTHHELREEIINLFTEYGFKPVFTDHGWKKFEEKIDSLFLSHTTKGVSKGIQLGREECRNIIDDQRKAIYSDLQHAIEGLKEKPSILKSFNSNPTIEIHKTGYNQALDDVLSLLKERKDHE